MGILGLIGKGLTKTKEALSKKLGELFGGRDYISEEDLDELEAVLLQADLGQSTVERILTELRSRIEADGRADRRVLEGIICGIIEDILSASEKAEPVHHRPHVMVLLGVNGTGKTTSAGKIAYALSGQGKKVVLAAADTFRAAAIEQLEIWAGRAGAELVKHKQGSDPSAVAFDAAKAAVNRNADYLIVDTAGRLHTKSNLMEELKKVGRVIGGQIESAPHETLLVIDATTGQNGLIQAREFNKAIPLTGIILTKLDGTAKGGIVVAVSEELGIPVKYVGVGEAAEDLRPFNAREFVEGLFKAGEVDNAVS
ncbi:MAG TPA: signal recognition particle-docking protein FtsY [Bacillota bacterium]|nr:MAG: Signal recognition particle receptor FtsY [Firmicutes bacterium ADurb.Bin153]HNV34760.1 signal recognition particle-docking protein FtsY [Bacillota bacterium]HPU95481.1 signal recognition particle-docking protein FtsY [Bacillota bacterium]